MAETKTKPTNESVEDFLNRIPDEVRRADCFAVAKIMEEITGEKPKMWGPSIVGFGSYRYKYDSGREGDWPVTGFSPRKKDLTLYMMMGFAKHRETRVQGVNLRQDLQDSSGLTRSCKSCFYPDNPV